jgi:hypothetical protein
VRGAELWSPVPRVQSGPDRSIQSGRKDAVFPGTPFG